MFFSGLRKVSHFLDRSRTEMPWTPTQGLQKKKMVIKSPTSFYEDPFNNTAHYHVLKRYNFSCLFLFVHILEWASVRIDVYCSHAQL